MLLFPQNYKVFRFPQNLKRISNIQKATCSSLGNLLGQHLILHQSCATGHDLFHIGQAVGSGGTHSAPLRSTLLPSPASSLPRELVSGRHLPLPEAVGWPRPPEPTACPSDTAPVCLMNLVIFARLFGLHLFSPVVYVQYIPSKRNLPQKSFTKSLPTYF